MGCLTPCDYTDGSPWSRIQPTTYSNHELSAAQRTEIQVRVKFFLEQFCAAIGVANIFARISPRLQLQSHSAALERCTNPVHALAVRMIEPFCDSNQGCQSPRQSAVAVVQRTISSVMPFRLRFSI